MNKKFQRYYSSELSCECKKEDKTMNNKFKNYGLWLALFSLIGLIFRDIGLNFETYNEYIDLIMYILIGLGVVSNPSLGKGYIDKIGSNEEPQEEEIG